ncbi:hypothetical protein GCM10028778_20970 [Barrientosiimonas marina]|uniref:Uncharacterized protein n=1 Tax=Lentibacillus kimchii TaxID=1542911 RepID=A0ABW2UXJ9_9BACI
MSFTAEDLAVALRESMLEVSEDEIKQATQESKLLIEDGSVEPKGDIKFDSVTISKLNISGKIKFVANFPINNSKENAHGKYVIQFDRNLNQEATREIHIYLQSNNNVRYIYYENGALVKDDLVTQDGIEVQGFSCILDCLKEHKVANWIYAAVAAACAPACATVVGCAPCLTFAASGQASVMISCVNKCF